MSPLLYSVQVRSSTQSIDSFAAPQRAVDEHSFGSWIAVSAITLLGAGLRVAALGRKSFWLDELSSIGISSSPSYIDAVLHHEGNMALYYVLLRPWLRLGVTETSVRLLSAIAGIAAIPLMYLLARRVLNSRSAYIAAALLAVSPCAVVYSQEARAYSLLVLSVLASTYALVSLMERPSPGAALVYGFLAALMIYCHFFGALVIAAQMGSLAFVRELRVRGKSLVIAFATLVVLGWPVVWMALTQDPAHLDWVPPPSLLELYHVGIFLAGESGKALGAVLLILELGLVAVFVTEVARRQSAADLSRWKNALVIMGLVAPIALTLIASFVRPVFFHRFLIICLPFWLLMVAGGLEQVKSLSIQRWGLIVLSLLSVWVIVGSYSKQREDWRGATRYLLANVAPDDRLICYRDYACFALETYAGAVLGKAGWLHHAIGVSQNPDNWQERIAGAPRVWMVAYPTKTYDTTIRDINNDLQKRYSEVQRKDFQSISVIEYERKQ